MSSLKKIRSTQTSSTGMMVAMPAYGLLPLSRITCTQTKFWSQFFMLWTWWFPFL